MTYIKNTVTTSLALLYLLFEKVAWGMIAKPISQYINNNNIYNNVLLYIEIHTDRYLILMIFLFLFITSEVLGLLSLTVFANGEVVLGVSLYVLKTLLVVLAFTILDRNRDKLMSFKWFEFIYNNVVKYIGKIKRTVYYRITMVYVTQVKKYIKLKIKVIK